MSERKIFNYQSEILKELTFEKEGYYPESLGNSSAKFIYAVCRFCGQPSRIRKGFFIKAGSACHKECRFKEQSIYGSPFKDQKNVDKAKETNLKKYGSIYASCNSDIANKISNTKKTNESKNKTKKTNIEKYGVENVFQSDEIKEKIKQKLIEKYNVDSPLKNEEIKKRVHQTVLDKYGVDNICFIPESAIVRKNNFNNTIKANKNGRYDIINILRSEDFWNYIIEGKTLKQVSEIFNVDYVSLSTSLSREEFKDRFRKYYCYPKTQKQSEIANLLKEYGLEVIQSSREIISPLELDIFIPEKKFAIEFNGSCWHSEKMLDIKKARNKHFEKLLECRKKNIRLINIFEKTWDDRKNQIMNFIKSSLYLNDIKVDARKCDIKEMECKSFINNNHIQGFGNRTIKTFVLLYYDKIVGAMTASSHHRQNIKGNPIVLNRLCFADNVSVRGGSGKLFSVFKNWAKENNYDRVISFSDNCLTEGGVYESLGFVMKEESKPEYFYWDEKNNLYFSKQSQRKSKTKCPDGITEREWSIYNNKYRIWDCGKKRWEYSL